MTTPSPAWWSPIRWALLVPFFGMPILLTIDAPDIHGGFAIHVRQALVLAVVGLAAALAAGGLKRGLDTDSRLTHSRLVPVLGWSLLGLAAGNFAGPTSIVLADGLGALTGLLPTGYGTVEDVWGPSRLQRRLLLVFGVLAPWLLIPRPRRGADLLGVVGSAAAVLVWTRMVGFSGQVTRPWVLDQWAGGLLGAIAVVWFLLRTRPAAAWIARGVVVGGAALYGFAWQPDGAAGVLLAAAGAGIAWAVTDPQGIGLGERLDRWGQRPGPALAWGLVAIALLTGSQVAILGTSVVSDALATLLGMAPDSEAAIASRTLPGPIRLAAALTALGATARLAGGRAPVELARLAAWALAWTIGARTIGLLIGGSGATAGLFLGLGAWLLAMHALARDHLPTIPRHAGPALGALVGPAVGALLTTALLPVDLPALLILLGGAAAGGALGFAAERSLPDAPTPPSALLLTLVVVLLGLLLPIMTGIALGVSPLLAGTVCVATLVAGALPRVRWRYAVFGGFYALILIVMTFKNGPDEDTCADVIAASSSELVLARFGADDALRSAQPYDVLPVADGSLLVTFKQIGREGGFFELIGPARAERLRLPTARRGLGGTTALWPERLELDPTTGRVWAQMIGAGHHAMWEVAPGPGPRLHVTRTLDIPWEPGNPGIDVARNRLVLTWVPNRQGDNPLLSSFSLGSLTRTHRTGGTGSGPEMADYVAVDPVTGNYWVPDFLDFWRFALVEVDGDTGRVLRRQETFHPTVGIAADSAAGLLYATNSTAGTLDVYSLATLERVQRLPAGRFPRDLVLDRTRRRLHVAGYADGTVSSFAIEDGRLSPIGATRVGSLLRGVGLDPTTGAVFAASGCGVFAIPEAGS